MKARRLVPATASPQTYAALSSVEATIRDCGLPHSLIELVKMRASQINGCAYCLNLHSKDARGQGESEQRLYLLDAWAEAPCYTEAERAALAWTECLTRIATAHAPDEAYDALGRHFSGKAIVDLTVLIGMINLWNRLAIGMGYEVPIDAPRVGA